jgi:hypothetical protein
MEDLEGPHFANLMRELATYMAQWRGKLLKADRTGNMKCVEDVSRNQQGEVTIAGLLCCHSVLPEPIISSLDYYCIKLEDQLTKLKAKDVFATIRNKVSPVIRAFAEKTLLGL